MPPGFPEAVIQRRHRRDRRRRNRRAAPCTPPPRTAPVAAAPRPPRPLSPRGIRRRRPHRSRTARGHDRARASDVQASFRAAIAVPARPQLPFGSAGTFPAGNAPNRDRESLIHIFPVNDAADQVLQPARQRRHIERIVQRVDGELRLTAQATPPTPSPDAPDAATALGAVSPAGWAERTVERQVARHRLDLPGGDDMTSAVRAHHRRRQPHVDRKARQAARAPSRSRLPPLGMHRRKMSTDQPLVAHRLPSLTSRPAAARPLSAQPVGSPVYARRTVHPSARPRALGGPVLLAGSCSGAGFIRARAGRPRSYGSCLLGAGSIPAWAGWLRHQVAALPAPAIAAIVAAVSSAKRPARPGRVSWFHAHLPLVEGRPRDPFAVFLAFPSIRRFRRRRGSGPGGACCRSDVRRAVHLRTATSVAVNAPRVGVPPPRLRHMAPASALPGCVCRT